MDSKGQASLRNSIDTREERSASPPRFEDLALIEEEMDVDCDAYDSVDLREAVASNGTF